MARVRKSATSQRPLFHIHTGREIILTPFFKRFKAMIMDFVLVLLPFGCGVVAGSVIAYPRGFKTGYARAKKLLPDMVDQAVRETLNVDGGKGDGDTNQTPQ